MSADIAHLIAQPGDPDLDCDVHDLTVTAVIIDDRTILLRLVDGTGRFHDSISGQMTRPGMHVTEVDIQMRFPDMPDAVFADYVTQLQQWRDAGTRLRMCAAPGKISTLIENRRRFLPMPRRWPPAGWCDD